MKPAFRNIMAKLAVLLLWGTAAFAQAPEATATWKVTAGEKTAEGCVLTFTADIIDGWHIYSVSDPYNPVAVTFEQTEGLTVEGELVPVTTPSELDGSEVFYETAVFRQTVRVEGSKTLEHTLWGNLLQVIRLYLLVLKLCAQVRVVLEELHELAAPIFVAAAFVADNAPVFLARLARHKANVAARNAGNHK